VITSSVASSQVVGGKIGKLRVWDCCPKEIVAKKAQPLQTLRKPEMTKAHDDGDSLAPTFDVPIRALPQTRTRGMESFKSRAEADVDADVDEVECASAGRGKSLEMCLSQAPTFLAFPNFRPPGNPTDIPSGLPHH
jgi:hypothetical protein